MSNLEEDLKRIRRDYDSPGLDESDIPNNPGFLMKAWLSEAMEAGLNEPNAFTLATIGKEFPDCRIVLLRTLEDEGLSFYTNYTSQKAIDMENHPNVTANFFWLELHRQIKIKGSVEKLSAEQSDAYFASRPRESQLGAWASDQSKVLTSRAELENKYRELKERYKGESVPRPDFWGGYLIRPSYYEFWQGRPSRLHDRITYRLNEDRWDIVRLSP